MKFREEVVAKIFTYITVVVLLGIVAFEAYLLQTERSRRRQAQEQEEALTAELAQSVSLNLSLQAENKSLKEFKDEWDDYAAFEDSREVLTLKSDLFSRPNLIPQEALLALLSQEDEEEDPETPEEKLKDASFTFDNPEGEDIFLPFTTGIGRNSACVVYTAAFEESSGGAIELLFEINFKNQRNIPEKDENNEIAWQCIAYNTGTGWIGIVE